MPSVIKGQLGHEQAKQLAVVQGNGRDVQLGHGGHPPNFGHLLNHRRQRHRAQTLQQLVLKFERHAFGHHGRIGQDLQSTGAQALRVQWAASALHGVHEQRGLVQPIQQARALGLHAQLPAIERVVLPFDLTPRTHQGFGLVLPLQSQAIAGHQSAGLAAQLQQQVARHAVQFDFTLESVRAEAAGRRTGFHQVKNIAIQSVAGLPDRVVRRGFAAEFFGFAPVAVALLRRPLDGQVEHRFVARLGHRQGVHKLVQGGTGHGKGHRAIGVFQTRQPVAHLVLGVAQGTLFFHLRAARQHLRRRAIRPPLIEQCQALHRCQDAQSRAMLAVTPHRASATTAPLAQVAAGTHPQLGTDRIGPDIVALHLTLQSPAIAIGCQLRRQHLVLQIQGGPA